MSPENRYNSLFRYYGELAGNRIGWRWLRAQALAESALDPKAVSPAGAKGLTQFMDPTWGEWGKGDVFNPEQAIEAQCEYMNWLMDKLNDRRRAFAAYNWGIGNVQRAGTDWEIVIPKETCDYIARIERLVRKP